MLIGNALRGWGRIFLLKAIPLTAWFCNSASCLSGMSTDGVNPLVIAQKSTKYSATFCTSYDRMGRSPVSLLIGENDVSKHVTLVHGLAIAVGFAMFMVIGYAWAGPPAGYVKVFDDRFTTRTLDTHKWWTRLRENGGTAQSIPSNHEQERYVENAGTHVMTGHSIQLVAQPQTEDGTYPSGVIRSKELFDLASGTGFYFETRAKVPGGQGTWPGVWLASDKRPDGSLAWPPEIDIMEFINAGDSDNINTFHCGIKTNGDQTGYKASFTQVVDGFDGVDSKWPTNIDFSAGFHTYALLYKQPNFMIWMDGALVLSGTYLWVLPDHTPAPPAHVIAQLAVGGTAGRNGIAAKFPQVMEIDYIHVYKEALPDRSLRGRS